MAETKYLRVIDEIGNKADYEVEFIPRIGERILLEFARGQEQKVRSHYYRVKDVQYNLGQPVTHQVAILIEEERDAEPWPS
jgi:hypothetical protein